MPTASIPAAAIAADAAATAPEVAGAVGAAGATDAAASAAALPLLSGFGDAATSSLPLLSGFGDIGGALGSGLVQGFGADATTPLLSGFGADATGAAGAGGSSGTLGNIASTLGLTDPNSVDAAGNPIAQGFADSAFTPSGVTAAPGGTGKGVLDFSNPLRDALAGTTGLSAVQALLPKKKVNVGQNAASVLGTNPGFSNPNLPQYTMQNTATPYQGNWYTYGQTPQTPLYNAMPVPAKKGGLMGYAHGGQVRGYAMGGQPMGMPPQAPMPPQGMPAPGGMPQGMPQPMQKPVNPLALKAAHNIGLAIGQHLKNKMRTPPGQVKGAGGGQDDAIPAKLSQDEFIMPADVVSKLGDGSSNAGGEKLMKVIHGVRAHTATKGFPKKSKANPLSYIPKGASA